jgi:hypothetical protein
LPEGGGGGGWAYNYTTTTNNIYTYTTTYNATFTTNGYWPMATSSSGGAWVEAANAFSPWPTPLSDEQREAQRQQRRDHEERRRRETQAREQANDRAVELLLSFLSEEQRRTYDDHEWFEVVGSAGGRYRLHASHHIGNIGWLDEQDRHGMLCCHPRDERLPIGDVLLAQMLALVTDEESFVRLANRYSGGTHPIHQQRRREREAQIDERLVNR